MSVQEGISTAFWGVKKVKPRETNITYPNVYVEAWNSDIAKMGSRIPCIRWWQVVRRMNDERMVSIHNDTPIRRNNLWCGIAQSTSYAWSNSLYILK